MFLNIRSPNNLLKIRYHLTVKPPLSFELIEKKAIFDALDQSSGNVPTAARNLGISRATLYRHQKKYRAQ